MDATYIDDGAYDYDAILDGMVDAGLLVSWEYPGCVVIQYAPTLQVWTGLHGFEYGSVSRLVDGEWQPDCDDIDATVVLPEGEDRPDVIVQAWADWVAKQPRA